MKRNPKRFKSPFLTRIVFHIAKVNKNTDMINPKNNEYPGRGNPTVKPSKTVKNFAISGGAIQ